MVFRADTGNDKEIVSFIYIVAFMPLGIAKQLLSNFYLCKRNFANPKNGVAYKKERAMIVRMIFYPVSCYT